MSKISKHITYKEATRSATALRLGIENKPSEYELQNMELIAEKVFEPLRESVNGPIKINSFFRCEELNKAIGGSSRSQHCQGRAILKIILILTNLFGNLVQILNLIGFMLVM